MITHEKTIIGVIGVWLHNHPNDKKHKIEFTTEELKCIEKSLTDYEQLQRDVKRFMELEDKDCNLYEINEYTDLLTKLLKVGK